MRRYVPADFFRKSVRLSRGPLNEEQINAVAALIDAAATGVEQII
jgi:hypothetical protein